MGVRSWWRGDQVKQALIDSAETATLRAAEFMRLKAQQHVPVDTGFLHNSIIVYVKPGGGYQVIATAPYAKFVEFGHLNGSAYVAPNPFMRKALADTAMAFPSILATAAVTSLGGMHGSGAIGTNIS
jgi:HK97 gp10 family phage protein